MSMERHFSNKEKFKFCYSQCPNCRTRYVGWYRKCEPCNVKTENKQESILMTDLTVLLNAKEAERVAKQKTVKHLSLEALEKRHKTRQENELKKEYAAFKVQMEKLAGHPLEDNMSLQMVFNTFRLSYYHAIWNDNAVNSWINYKIRDAKVSDYFNDTNLKGVIKYLQNEGILK